MGGGWERVELTVAGSASSSACRAEFQRPPALACPSRPAMSSVDINLSNQVFDLIFHPTQSTLYAALLTGEVKVSAAPVVARAWSRLPLFRAHAFPPRPS